MLPGCWTLGPEAACRGQRQPCCSACSCLLGRAVELTVAWGDSGSRGAAVARQERSRSLLLPTVTREAPADWRLADVPPGDRKGWKDFPGNYRPVSLTSVSDTGLLSRYGHPGGWLDLMILKAFSNLDHSLIA